MVRWGGTQTDPAKNSYRATPYLKMPPQQRKKSRVGSTGECTRFREVESPGFGGPIRWSRGVRRQEQPTDRMGAGTRNRPDEIGPLGCPIGYGPRSSVLRVPHGPFTCGLATCRSWRETRGFGLLDTR